MYWSFSALTFKCLLYIVLTINGFVFAELLLLLIYKMTPYSIQTAVYRSIDNKRSKNLQQDYSKPPI